MSHWNFVRREGNFCDAQWNSPRVIKMQHMEMRDKFVTVTFWSQWGGGCEISAGSMPETGGPTQRNRFYRFLDGQA